MLSLSGVSEAGTISRTTIADNTNSQIDGDGGLTLTLGSFTIADSQILRNSGYVGGIDIQNGADVTVANTTIAANTATATSGYAYAGGILANGGSLALTNSTVSGNTAARCTQGTDCSAAGGIGTSIPVTITNSTLSGNSGGGFASGEHSEYGLPASILTNVTVVTNDTGVAAVNGTAAHPAVLLRNSLLANSGANCGGIIASGGYNLVSDATCGFAGGGTDQIGVNPNLGPLASNGGPTQTHALNPGSPAIDAIPAAGGCRFGISTDQRGIGRPSGAGATSARTSSTSTRCPVRNRSGRHSRAIPRRCRHRSHWGRLSQG